jgi:hypothetical protein
MCFQLLLALTLFPCQEPAAVSEPQVRFGQLRHVQLLEPRGEIVRIATQIELGTMKGPWPEGEDTYIVVFDGESTEPVEELAVGASLIGDFTWLERSAWFLMELGKSRRLVVLERKLGARNGRAVGGKLRVLSFPGGEEIMRVGRVQEIEDALVHAGQSDLIVGHGVDVKWFRFSETGEVDLDLDAWACATLIRGKRGEEQSAWGVGWRGDELFAVPFG